LGSNIPESIMNLAIITTTGNNSGDNFIYEGFKNLFPTKHYGSVFLVNKVDIPINDCYKEFIDESDLIVICGSPIFYDKCYKMKWQNNILSYSKSSGKKIMLNAVGSNFKGSADGKINVPDISKDNNYASFVSKYREVSSGDFTVRDRYCFEFLKDIGISNVKQIVCPSLFSADDDNVQDDRDLIFIIWGDTFWNCEVPSQKVLETCIGVQRSLESRIKNKKIVWVCHDYKSYKGLLNHVNRHDILFSSNYIDFFKYYKRCFFAFSVKVHGTMLLASMGTPSLLLQLDSRAFVLEALNESCATPSTSIEQLTDMCLEKIEESGNYRSKIRELKRRYKEEYEEILGRINLI
jgi:hypothetical protein